MGLTLPHWHCHSLSPWKGIINIWNRYSSFHLQGLQSTCKLYILLFTRLWGEGSRQVNSYTTVGGRDKDSWGKNSYSYEKCHGSFNGAGEQTRPWVRMFPLKESNKIKCVEKISIFNSFLKVGWERLQCLVYSWQPVPLTLGKYVPLGREKR